MTVAKKFTSPALPLPAQAYDVMSENEKSRVFRLYFNLLDKYLNDLTTIMNGGGPGLGVVFLILPHPTQPIKEPQTIQPLWLILAL
jgi:hypothetical protein